MTWVSKGTCVRSPCRKDSQINSPRQNIREGLLKAGAAIEAWHGTSGFLSAAGAACFLSRLRTLLRKRRPGAQRVVIRDAFMAHTNEGVLRHASRLGIQIVLVPRRLTWFLQPQDVYMFAFLKRLLRYALAREQRRDVPAKLSVSQQLTCCTEAVRTTLGGSAVGRQDDEVRPLARRGRAQS